MTGRGHGCGRSAAAVAGSIVLALAASACGAGDAGGGGSGNAAAPLTVYNAQHEDLMNELVAGFTKKTGIKVQARNGDDSEMANQIIQEGKRSPADVFVTENSPGIAQVDNKGLLAPVDQQTQDQVPKRFQPAGDRWVGIAARSTVLAYNPTKVTADRLPASIMDLADPRWKGQVGIAAAGADFQAIVSAVLAVEGTEKTEQWLQGLKQNAKIYQGNTAVMKAVNSGEIATGVIYHYYWYKDRAESGANSKNVELKFFGNQDSGAFVGTSGAGVLASSDQPKQAQQFLAYITSPEGQQIIADGGTFEYPVTEGVANPVLKPMAELQPPEVDLASLNGPKVVDLMQNAGLL